ncbi:MAG TPA: hypothetical protein ENJ30_01970 [Desulfobulbaceae bacterium]|nr:hypothetical protein [Desulfobulbaceae bacterium]
MTIKLQPLPMGEAQQFWRDKVKMGPGEFSRLSAEARTRAFAVSGIAKGDELDTVFAALQQAIDKGISFDEFKKQSGDIFERRGWVGKRAWRVDNIFRTNIQTAYNVGHYKQLMDDRDVFPYWQYSAINDSRTRPTHLAMDGRVWPADDPTWATWFPPNGFRCRCSVVGLTRGQVKARGLKVEQKDPTNRLIEPIDQASGNRMPARPLIPDPGFKYNLGKSYWGSIGETLADKLNAWPERLSALVLQDMVGGPGFEHWLQNPAGEYPVGLLQPEAATAIGAQTRTVTMSAETAGKQLRVHPELQAGDYVMVQRAIDNGEVIQDGKHHLIYILDQDGYVTVVKSTRTGQTIWLVSFRRLSSDEAKKDRELLRLRKKK